jgi:hypothetical protein
MLQKTGQATWERLPSPGSAGGDYPWRTHSIEGVDAIGGKQSVRAKPIAANP